MEILLIRHGKSVQSGGGHVDIPLSTEGELQASATGRSLVGYGIKTIYSSPLSRALKTAEIIGHSLYLTPVAIPNLMERSDGIFDGMTREQITNLYPSEYAKFLSNPLEPAPNGESFQDVKRRAESVIHEIVDQRSNDVIACVSHGGFLNLFIMTLLSLSDDLYPLFRFENAAVSSISVDAKGKAMVNYMNRVHPLD